MPTPRTSPLGYILPRGGDKAEISKINDYFTQLVNDDVYTNRCMIAPFYDPSRVEPYMTGDIVQYERVAYRCLEDNVSGNWDATKWEQTTLGAEIATKGGGSAEVTKEASGNPIELTDAASAPMVRCVTEIQGSQDLHGYDKPWVGGAGKNKLDYSNEIVHPTSQTTTTLVNGLPLKAGTYTFSLNQVTTLTSATRNTLIVAYDGNTYYESASTGHHLQSGVHSITFTLESDTSVDLRLWTTELSESATYNNAQLESGSTATSYAPYSNICPITAYTENTISVGDGTDKNYSTTGIEGYVSYYYVDVISAKSFRLYTTSNQTYPATKQTLESLGIEAGKKYTLECDVDITTGTAMIGTRLSNNSIEEVSEVLSSDGHITFTFTPTSAVNFSFFGSDGTSVKCDVTYSNIVLYEGNPRTTHTTTYPSAIYRGSEDCVNGEVTSDTVYEEFDGTATVAFGRSGQSNWYYSITSSVTLSSAALPISNKYVGASVLNDNDELGIYKLANGSIRIRVGGTQPSDTSGFLAELANTPLQVVSQTEPTTSSVTPTNLPIRTLSGYNHIESSTGDMEVEYITEEYQPLVELIEENSGGGSSYSEMVLWSGSVTAPTSGDLIELSSDITNFDAIYLVVGSGTSWYIPAWFITSQLTVGGHYCGPVNGAIGANWYLTSTSSITVISMSNSDKTTYSKVVGIKFSGGGSNQRVYSTQTRSLNASLNTQKAQIEPLTDKTEEVPTEEEKAVNEAINEQKEEEQR